MRETYKNYFGKQTAAERYAGGRPHFHSAVITRIKNFLALETSLRTALDVGCGTGLSSVALKAISEMVVGVDVSFEMLIQAVGRRHGIEYLQAGAENLPFGRAEFDLITISQAIHWVDQERFFAEADRVLREDSVIAAYDNYFQGEMLENPDFNIWYRSVFLEKYPVPPRGKRAFDRTGESAAFVLTHAEFNENTLEFSVKELVDYLVTITNVIAAVENGVEPIEDVYEWLTESMEPFFDKSRKEFAFINPIWFLRRNF